MAFTTKQAEELNLLAWVHELRVCIAPIIGDMTLAHAIASYLITKRNQPQAIEWVNTCDPLTYEKVLAQLDGVLQRKAVVDERIARSRGTTKCTS